tara:strand:+ start:513 stop:1124 length:612 start_codon:yes stop_codon:yes gene_type:complete
MNKSENIDKLAAALSKTQGGIEGAKKEQTNPFFNSQYSDLKSCWLAVRDHLVSNGLSITQLPGKIESTEAGRTISLETVLMHSSGQWISTEASLPVTKPDAHGCSSALTYLRRISLSAILSLTSEPDDDGNASIDTKSKDANTSVDPKVLKKHLKDISSSDTMPSLKEANIIAFKFARDDQDALSAILAAKNIRKESLKNAQS